MHPKNEMKQNTVTETTMMYNSPASPEVVACSPGVSDGVNVEPRLRSAPEETQSHNRDLEMALGHYIELLTICENRQNFSWN